MSEIVRHKYRVESLVDGLQMLPIEFEAAVDNGEIEYVDETGVWEWLFKYVEHVLGRGLKK